MILKLVRSRYLAPLGVGHWTSIDASLRFKPFVLWEYDANGNLIPLAARRTVLPLNAVCCGNQTTNLPMEQCAAIVTLPFSHARTFGQRKGLVGHAQCHSVGIVLLTCMKVGCTTPPLESTATRRST